MSKAYQCDLCNWFFKENPRTLMIEEENEIYDICPKCYERFETKFIAYIKEQRGEQGSFNASTRRFTPYEDKKEPVKKEDKVEPKNYIPTPKPEPKYKRRNTEGKSRRCGNCQYRDSARISGKGYACNCLHNDKHWVEIAMKACPYYEGANE